jgi:hypothetical protein
VVAVKRFRAMIWEEGTEEAGKRVSLEAESLNQARHELEAQYGEGSVFDLHDEEDASRPR